MTMKGFKDRVAIVTGGASGIGREVCRVLGESGSTLVVADIDEQGAEATAEAVRGKGGRARAARLDVTRAEAVESLVEETAAVDGRLDFMFNNAGINIAGEVRDLLPEHWQRVLDVNLMGVIHGTTAAYPLMVRQGFGHIVNTASLCGIIPVPLEAPYALTKHAVVGLSTSLRAEGAGLGVKVSVFCPGVIETPLLENSTMINSTMAEVLDMSPLGRMNVRDGVRDLLRGVAKNRAMIVCPLSSRIAWWYYRMSPALVDLIARMQVRMFRRDLRSPEKGQGIRDSA